MPGSRRRRTPSSLSRSIPLFRKRRGSNTRTPPPWAAARPVRASQAGRARSPPLGRPDAAGLASRVWWHVVVEHEAILVLSEERIDDLLVASRTERRDHQGLRLAAREKRRAMSAGQDPRARRDRADGARIASVDTRFTVKNLIANDLGFEPEQEILDVVRLGGLSPVARSSSTRLRISERRLSRTCFCLMLNACRRSVSVTAAIRAISASSFGGGCHAQVGFPASSVNSLMALIADNISRWPNTTAPSITSSGSSAASDSTMSTACSVPATTRFSLLALSCVTVGLSTNSPSMYPTRAAPMGPLNGTPESASAAEHPMSAAMSGSTSGLTDMTVATTCTSL